MFATQARFGVHTRTLTPRRALGVGPGPGLELGLGLGLESRTTDDGSREMEDGSHVGKGRVRDEMRRDETDRLTAERTGDASEPRLSLDASTGGSELGGRGTKG
jgi:hypothetical protein